jgi:hypothetical protein
MKAASRASLLNTSKVKAEFRQAELEWEAKHGINGQPTRRSFEPSSARTLKATWRRWRPRARIITNTLNAASNARVRGKGDDDCRCSPAGVPDRRAGCCFAADLHRRLAHLLAWHGAASVGTCAVFTTNPRRRV